MPKDVDTTDEDGWVLCDAEGRPPCTPPSCAKPSYVKASVYEVDLSMRFAPTLESRRVVAVGPDDKSIIECYGQSFRWDPASGHQTIDELEPLRLLGDGPMDAAIEEVEPTPGEDMLDALARGAPSGAAATLLASLTAEPPWLDWGLLARGQEVYLRHLPSAGLVLFNVSLIGGFSAPKITKVLEQSGYLVGPPKLAMRRLFDTGRLMVDACANGPDALRAGGAGWRAAVRVRALHAKVRRRLLRRGGGAEPGSGSGGGGGGGRWDVETYGVPINQEDMAATLLAFSYNVLVGVEAIRGEELPEAEQEAFLHLWRYMGHLLGVAETHNPCAGGMRLAKARLESIILHLLHPDELSVRVATHLLKAPYAHLSAPRAARGFELSAQMTRLLVGDELGDALGLPFVPRARARARRTLRVLRAYGRACEHWLLGPLLVGAHRWMLRLLQAVKGEETFPMLCPAFPPS